MGDCPDCGGTGRRPDGWGKLVGASETYPCPTRSMDELLGKPAPTHDDAESGCTCERNVEGGWHVYPCIYANKPHDAEAEAGPVHPWTLYRTRLDEGTAGEWQVAGTESAKRGVRTAHHTDVVEVIPLTALHQESQRAQKAERERESLRLERDGLLRVHQKDNEYLLARAESAESQLAEYREALEHTLRLAKDAVEHIVDDLQPAFKGFAETGRLPWPSAWGEQYDDFQAAMRLATWWHGVNDDETLCEARSALQPDPPHEGEQNRA